MKLTTKLILSLMAVLFILTTGCSTFFKRNPAASLEKHKHYIMTLHGVRGNEVSFGEFHEVIKTHLEKIDPGYEVVPINMTYTIADVNYTIHRAAAEINGKLDKIITHLDPQDKISVVAYSMGGQAGMAWYYDSLKDPAHEKYARQTVKFISLGAAYWGAQEAALFANDVESTKRTIKGMILQVNKRSQELTKEYLGSYSESSLAAIQNRINTNDIFPIIDQLKTTEQLKDFYNNKKVKDYYKYDLAKILDLNETLKNIRNSSLKDLAKVSFAEIEALSIAGQTETELRLASMNNPNKTKWVSISTLVQCFETDLGAKTPGCNDFQNNFFANVNKSFAKYAFGFVRRETDNAVITPSSNAEFIYVVETNPNYEDGAKTPITASYFSIPKEQNKIYFAETLHATLVTEQMYNNAVKNLGRLGQSWMRLADDVVIVHKEKCLNPQTCDHPVYKYEVDELADCNRENSTCDETEYKAIVGTLQKSKSEEADIQNKLKSEIHGFTAELNLRVPVNYDLSKINESNILNYIKFNFEKNDQSDRILASTAEEKSYKIHFARPLELNSIQIKKITYSNQRQLKVNFTGIFVPNDSNKYEYQSLATTGDSLRFEVALPGLKNRNVEAFIKPYHSTYVDLMMANK